MGGMPDHSLEQLQDAIMRASSSALRSSFKSESEMLRHFYFSVYSARRNLRSIPVSFLDGDFVKWVASGVSGYRATSLKSAACVAGGKFGGGQRSFTCRSRANETCGPDNVQTLAFSLTQSPGFMSAAKGGLASVAVAERVKVYFAISPSAAPIVLTGLVDVIDSVAEDYAVKVLAHPRMYFRSDAAVLYARLSELDEIIDALSDDFLAKLRLRDVEPLASKRIRPGIAWAQDHLDPESGREMSFGQWVSGVVAASSGEDADNSNATALEDMILSAGRDPLHPYRLLQACG